MNIFETLARRYWLRWEEGRRVHGGRGNVDFRSRKQSPGLGFAKLTFLYFAVSEKAESDGFAPEGPHLEGPFPEVLFRPVGRWFGVPVR